MSCDEASMLNQCHPAFRFRLEQILSDLRSAGCEPRLASVRRTQAEQAQKVKKGYSKTHKSWHVPATVGMLPHGQGSVDVVRGNAADIVDARYGWSGLAANHSFQFWKDLGRIAKQHGCRWGGDWKKFRDVAHVEMLFIEQPAQSTADV